MNKEERLLRKEEKRKTKDFAKFIELLPKLNVAQVLGIAVILKVQLEKPCAKGAKPEPRRSDKIINDVMDKFLELGAKGRKEILTAMRDAYRNESREAAE